MLDIPFDSVAYLGLAALYSGGDDYAHAMQHIALGTLSQLQTLQAEGIWLKDDNGDLVHFTIYVIFVPDGLARRALTGYSTAASSFPCPSLRLHMSQVAEAMMNRYGRDYFTLMDGFYAHGAFRDPDHRFYGLVDNDANRHRLVSVTQGVIDYNLLGVDMRQVWPALLHMRMRTVGHIMGLVNFVYRGRTADPKELHELMRLSRIRVKFLTVGNMEIVPANGSQWNKLLVDGAWTYILSGLEQVAPVQHFVLETICVRFTRGFELIFADLTTSLDAIEIDLVLRIRANVVLCGLGPS